MVGARRVRGAAGCAVAVVCVLGAGGAAWAGEAGPPPAESGVVFSSPPSPPPVLRLPVAPVPAPSQTLTYVPDAEEPPREERAQGAGRRAAAQRVLPFGTGLVLVGLGLGFAGARLRWG
ncbi:hypothetical protein ACFQLX_07775 [Streptomyces polyrhachis]|uniref:Uncharacterized protein n=1 Tax=Streptomyces polyrhachis TaxID=1282885 RepID=A0ABW2GDV5_9ACTN